MAAVAFMKDFYVTLYEALKASKSWGARDLLACDVVAPRLKPAAGVLPDWHQPCVAPSHRPKSLRAPLAAIYEMTSNVQEPGDDKSSMLSGTPRFEQRADEHGFRKLTPAHW